MAAAKLKDQNSVTPTVPVSDTTFLKVVLEKKTMINLVCGPQIRRGLCTTDAVHCMHRCKHSPWR